MTNTHPKLIVKIQVNLLTYHLIPYTQTGEIQGIKFTEYGFLCFKFIISQKS